MDGNLFEDVAIETKQKPKQPVTTKSHIVDFPYCPVRIGRTYDGKTITTCGFREITLNECLDCKFQHTLEENKLEALKRATKNANDIRELKTEVAELRKLVNDLTVLIKKE